MEHQDWNQVVWNKKKNIHGHKNSYSEGHKNFLLLDSEEPPIPETIPKALSIQIQKARSSSGMTRRQLAMKLNVTQAEITGYETGTAIPNKAMLRKISTTLKVKLE